MLLDTHLLLWASGQPDRLPRQVRELLLDSSNSLFFGVASLWRIAMTGEHALAVAELPLLHKDPFDRILIAQARMEG